MSAELAQSWQLTLPCTKAEAQNIALAEADNDGVVLMVTEEDEASERWRLDAYFAGKPGAATVRAVRALAPSAAASKAKPAPIADADWVTLSQAGLEPVRAGRFFVYTAAYAGAVPPQLRAYRIEASQAFGTGHHETTTGCLMMLDAMKRRGARVDTLIDLGTGTGLLAFAALHLWPRAYATATDIDPIAIEVTAENAAINHVLLGQGQRCVALATANGTDDALVQRRAPYDLVIANILAGPLVDMAGDICAIAAPHGQIVLAGLLSTQAEAVARAYRRHGCRVAERLVLGDWTILRLRRRNMATAKH